MQRCTGRLHPRLRLARLHRCEQEGCQACESPSPSTAHKSGGRLRHCNGRPPRGPDRKGQEGSSPSGPGPGAGVSVAIGTTPGAPDATSAKSARTTGRHTRSRYSRTDIARAAAAPRTARRIGSEHHKAGREEREDKTNSEGERSAAHRAPPCLDSRASQPKQELQSPPPRRAEGGRPAESWGSVTQREQHQRHDDPDFYPPRSAPRRAVPRHRFSHVSKST